MIRVTLALLLLTGLAGSLRADLAGAKAAHTRGLQLEKTKQYQAAIQAYEAALAAEPRYSYSYKQIGNCKYRLGDKAGALRAYDAYLAVLKNDAKTRAFADALRKQVGAAPAMAPAAARPAQAQPVQARLAAAPASTTLAQSGPLRLGLDFGYHMLAFTEWNEEIKPSTPNPNQTSVATVGSGYSLGLALGYRIMPKLELGLDLDYYLVSALNEFKDPTSLTTQQYNFNALWIGPFVAYDFMAWPNGLSLNAGLGAGFMSLMGGGFEAKTTPGTGSTKASLSGGALGFKVKLGGTWQLDPRLGFNLDLGYRLASIPKVDYKSTFTSGGTTITNEGTLQRFGTGTSAPTDLPLDYSGVDLQVGAALRF